MKSFLANPRSAFALALGGLLLANAWIGWQTWIQWEQSRSAETQELHLLVLARKIEALRQRPAQIDEGVRTNDALARLVETSARQVGVDPEQIVRIDPSDPRRIEKTPYLEQKTNVELREISFRKLIEFSLMLEQSGKGMQVATLSVRIPSGSETTNAAEELWNAQVLLTSRIYEGNVPPSPSSRTP